MKINLSRLKVHISPVDTNIKQLMKDKKIKIQDLAKEFGISREYCGKLLSNIDEMKHGMLIELLNKLGYEAEISIKKI